MPRLSADTGYRAEFVMAKERTDWEILKKAPYCWNFDAFSEPYQAIEGLMSECDRLPTIILSDRNCVQPPEFLDFMEAR